MKLIRTIKKSVRKKTLIKNQYHTETSQPTNSTNQSTGLHTARVSTERQYGKDIIIRSKIPLRKRLHHTEARQLACNANQSIGLHTAQAPTKGHFRTDYSNNLIQIFKS